MDIKDCLILSDSLERILHWITLYPLLWISIFKAVSKLGTICANICEAKHDLKFLSLFTVHLNGKNLSTNSSWDFDGVLDTMDPYWFVPDKYFFPRSYLSRWRCDSLQELFKKVVKIKSRQHFQAKKTSATPKFCKRNFSRMLRFGNMNILSTSAPIFQVPKILVRYEWGEKIPSGKNK